MWAQLMRWRLKPSKDTTGVAKEVSYKFPWQVPKDVSEDVRPIAEEIVRRGRWDEHLGVRYQRHMRIWISLSYGLGVPAAALAAFAGFLATNSSQHNTLAGALALTSAAIGGVLAFLNPASRASSADARAKAHFRTSNWVRYALTAELPKADLETARNLLRALQTKKDDSPAAFTTSTSAVTATMTATPPHTEQPAPTPTPGITKP
jgi:hypothetical protein